MEAWPPSVKWHVEIRFGDRPWEPFSGYTRSREVALEQRDELAASDRSSEYRVVLSATTYAVDGEP